MSSRTYALSPRALRELKTAEGSIPYVYDDGDGTWPKRRIKSYRTKGHPTIGVGHLIRPPEYDRFRRYLNNEDMPEQEILALLRKDVARFERTLNTRIGRQITQSMWDALVIQAFNTGTNTRAMKAAIQAVNAGQWTAAQKALASGPVTSKGKIRQGLVTRRAQEARMFMRDGTPGLAQAGTQRAARRSGRYFRSMQRHRKRQLILGTGAAIFASIAAVAVLATLRR